REAIVERMQALLEAAGRDGVELIVYPEMALTTYFPKRIRSDFDQFFETEVPPKALEPLLRGAAGRTGRGAGGGVRRTCASARGPTVNTSTPRPSPTVRGLFAERPARSICPARRRSMASPR